jgi:hypothetical protein
MSSVSTSLENKGKWSMFGSTTLEVAIGIIIVYLILGLAVTSAKEGLATILRHRSKFLEEGINTLLHDSEAGAQQGVLHWLWHGPRVTQGDLATQVLQQPLIAIRAAPPQLAVAQVDDCGTGPACGPDMADVGPAVDVPSRPPGFDGGQTVRQIRELSRPSVVSRQRVEVAADQAARNVAQHNRHSVALTVPEPMLQVGSRRSRRLVFLPRHPEGRFLRPVGNRDDAQPQLVVPQSGFEIPHD